MAIPSVGGGQQIGDGNVNESLLGVMSVPQTATSSATLTAAQILGGVLVGNPSTSAASYALPTAASVDAALANVKIGSTFDLNIINLGTTSGVITITVGTGWTLVGMVTLPITTSAGSSGYFRAYRTGAAAWTLYRIC